MRLDLSRLQHVQHRGEKLVAQCPACAADGGDASGEHFVRFTNGGWGCVAFPGNREHRRRIAALLGSAESSPFPSSAPFSCRAVPPKRRPLSLPAMRFPTVAELAQIAALRGLPAFAGLELAARAGMLRTATLRDGVEQVAAWVFLDSSRRCAQARRLDGEPWASLGNAKARNFAGSDSRWPIGIADAADKPHVALCEGPADALAAWTLAWWHGCADEVAPLAVCGAIPLADDALPHFRGKTVFLFPDNDPAGHRIRETWRGQLEAAGATVRTFDLAPAKDLNEAVAAAASAEHDGENQ